MNLLTKKEAARKVGLHPESVMRLAREGHFPKPLKYGPNPRHSIRFVESEVAAWIAERMAEREQPPKRKRGRPKGSKNKTTAKKTGRRGWPSIASRNPIKVGG